MDPSALAASITDPASPPAGFDLALRLTSRTIGTPLGASVPDAQSALRAYAAGARLLVLPDAHAALPVSLAIDLVRASGRFPALDGAFGEAFLFVRLPETGEPRETLDALGDSLAARDALAAALSNDERRPLGDTRPLTAVSLDAPRGLDLETEALARAVVYDWGDDLLLALGASADPAPLPAALERLRKVAESCGCTLLVRAPASAPPALLAALAPTAAEIPLWLADVPPAETARAITRGAVIVSPPAPTALAASLAALGDRGAALRAKRVGDLVLLEGAPDEALRRAGEALLGANWFTAYAKNAVLALDRLAKARGVPFESALAREAAADPPPDCCLYRTEEPDLREASGVLYERWIAETQRARLQTWPDDS